MKNMTQWAPGAGIQVLHAEKARKGSWVVNAVGVCTAARCPGCEFLSTSRHSQERGLPFEQTTELEWSAARVRPDGRHDYGEERFVALVPSDAIRIISFRKANKREERAYGKAPDEAAAEARAKTGDEAEA
jgi:hypothetical protein